MSKEREPGISRASAPTRCAREMIFRQFGPLCSKVIPLLRAFRGKDLNVTGGSWTFLAAISVFTPFPYITAYGIWVAILAYMVLAVGNLAQT